MKVFLVFVNDENFYRLLPEDMGGSKPGDPRVKVMGFPPLGIETLAPVLRKHGHQVRMFDTCHPEMKERDIAQAVRDAFRAERSMPVTTSSAVLLNPKEVVSRSMGYRDIVPQVSVIQRFSSSDVNFVGNRAFGSAWRSERGRNPRVPSEFDWLGLGRKIILSHGAAKDVPTVDPIAPRAKDLRRVRCR